MDDDALLTSLRALAARGHGAFRFGAALDLGIDETTARRMARTGEWVRLRHGVYALREHVERLDAWGLHHLRCAAEVLALGFGPALSHETAAALHRMPFLGDPADRPHVTRVRRRPDERTERAELHLAELPAEHLTVVQGLQVTAPARTAADLARRDGLLAGVVAADAAMRLGATAADLASVARHCWFWPGGATAVEAAALARAGSESALETGGRVALVSHGAPEPELQVELWRYGRFVARLDQLWRQQLLVGEADGKVKYTDAWRPSSLLEEKRRQEDIEGCGLSVLRYDWAAAFYRQRELKARWDTKAASAWQRRLAPGVELRLSRRAAA
jgi:hypothetical protein